MDKPVKFDAEVRKIVSMADGTFNLTLNIPEYNLDEAKDLMGWLRDQVAVAIVRVSETENHFHVS